MPRSSFCLLQQIFKLVHALLQLVLLAYPAFELDGAKLGVGYLVSHGGCLALNLSLQNLGIEGLEQPFDLSYLRVVAALGSLRSCLVAILCPGRIVRRAVVATSRRDALATLPIFLYGATSSHQRPTSPLP